MTDERLCTCGHRERRHLGPWPPLTYWIGIAVANEPHRCLESGCDCADYEPSKDFAENSPVIVKRDSTA